MSEQEFTIETLATLTCRYFPGGGESTLLSRITKGGSDRTYYRCENPSLILMHYTDARPDNLSFAATTEVLSDKGVHVPRILRHDEEKRLMWIQDVGSKDLWELREKAWQDRRRFYQATLREVAKLHRIMPEMIGDAIAPKLQGPFDEALYLWEQDYFFENYCAFCTDLGGAAIRRIRSSNALRNMAKSLAELPRSMVHRDFQSQNVIMKDDQPWFIDHQGLRPGRPEYDLASLLFDPYVPITNQERQDLEDYYFQFRATEDGWESDREIYLMCAAQRLMQALGAYGRLGKVLGKTEFLDHIPLATQRLRGVAKASEKLAPLLDALPLST